MKSTLALLVLLLGAGCASGGAGLRARAAFDFACPAEQIDLRLIGSAMGARGCGKRATYVEACEGLYGRDCQWLINGGVSSD